MTPEFINNNVRFDIALLERMGDVVNCGFMLYSEGGERAFAYINEKLARYAGYSKAEFVDRFARYMDCVYPEDRLYARQAIKKALQKGDEYEVIYRVPHTDGNVVWIRENGKRARTSDGESVIVCALMDISRDMAQRLDMENKSRSDSLTGTLNREAFIDRVSAILADSMNNSVKHALIMLDIDDFRGLNEALGHDSGDKILKDITTSVRATIRSGDLFGRLGGDEFMLCLRDISVDNSFHRRMDQLRALVNRPVAPDVAVSCSLGIAIFRQDGEDFETLSTAANAALAEAKKRGRNRFVLYKNGMDDGGFTPHMTPIDRDEPV